MFESFNVIKEMVSVHYANRLHDRPLSYLQEDTAVAAELRIHVCQ